MSPYYYNRRSSDYAVGVWNVSGSDVPGYVVSSYVFNTDVGVRPEISLSISEFIVNTIVE